MCFSSFCLCDTQWLNCRNLENLLSNSRNIFLEKNWWGKNRGKIWPPIFDVLWSQCIWFSEEEEEEKEDNLNCSNDFLELMVVCAYLCFPVCDFIKTGVSSQNFVEGKVFGKNIACGLE